MTNGIFSRLWRLRPYSGLLVALTAVLVCLPFLRSVWIVSDEGIFLHAALRMLDGKILYRDFFEFHPPLSFLIVEGWMSAFGTTLLAARLLVVTDIALTAWLTHACCRIMSRRPGLPTYLTVVWLLASQGDWTQVNHHWLTSLFSMIAFWALLSAEGKSGRLALAGAAASAATLVTTHRGGLIALAGLVALLPGRSIKALSIYVGSGLAFFAAIVAVLWWQGSLGQAYEEVVLYPTQHYSDIQGVRFGAFATTQTVFLVAAFPLTGGLLAIAILRDGFALLRRRGWNTAAIFATVGLLGCFPRPDGVHIAFCVVLALPLLAALLDHLLPRGRPGTILAAMAITTIALPLCGWLSQVLVASAAQRVATRAGTVQIIPRNGTAEIIARLNGLPPTDTVFYYPYDPLLPFLTKPHHPATLDVLVPQYSTPEQYRQSCLEVMTRAQWVVFDAAVTKPSFYRTVFPAMTTPSPPEKLRLEDAVHRGFVLTGRYGEFELWRKAHTDIALCG